MDILKNVFKISFTRVLTCALRYHWALTVVERLMAQVLHLGNCLDLFTLKQIHLVIASRDKSSTTSYLSMK